MIEHIPNRVEKALFYFHSAGTNSDELKPYIEKLIENLPNTYIWVGDGFISESPLTKNKANYGKSSERFWFMFPMQDASTQQSFSDNASAVGASLITAGSYMNYIVDQTMTRFNITLDKITLSGFQHGSSLVLATAMIRKDKPFTKIILLEPYLLEAYYLKDEVINDKTMVICIENKYIQDRGINWIGNSTTNEMKKFGINILSIVLESGEEKIDELMIDEMIKQLLNSK